MLESGLNKENISFLQCTSDYPAKVEDSNINVIKKMKEHFNVRVGYSDHTDGHLSALLALAAGATIFEKHFTFMKFKSFTFTSRRNYDCPIFFHFLYK